MSATKIQIEVDKKNHGKKLFIDGVEIKGFLSISQSQIPGCISIIKIELCGPCDIELLHKSDQ